VKSPVTYHNIAPNWSASCPLIVITACFKVHSHGLFTVKLAQRCHAVGNRDPNRIRGNGLREIPTLRCGL